MRSKYIQKDVVAALRRDIGSDKWLPLRISLETGLRIGDCVDLLYGQIHRKRDGRYVITATASKTGKTDDFEISEGLYKLLLQKRAQNGSEKSSFIFPSYGASGHLTRQAAWARMKTAAVHLGISPEGISPHSLRKCFAVALRHERGLEAVRKALQHSNDAVTRVYAYADTVLNFASDEPIRWMDLEMIVDYILERLHEKT